MKTDSQVVLFTTQMAEGLRQLTKSQLGDEYHFMVLIAGPESMRYLTNVCDEDLLAWAKNYVAMNEPFNLGFGQTPSTVLN